MMTQMNAALNCTLAPCCFDWCSPTLMDSARLLLPQGQLLLVLPCSSQQLGQVRLQLLGSSSGAIPAHKHMKIAWFCISNRNVRHLGCKCTLCRPHAAKPLAVVKAAQVEHMMINATQPTTLLLLKTPAFKHCRAQPQCATQGKWLRFKLPRQNLQLHAMLHISHCPDVTAEAHLPTTLPSLSTRNCSRNRTAGSPQQQLTRMSSH